MPFKETIQEISDMVRREAEEQQKRSEAISKLRETRLGELKEREKPLLYQADGLLTSYLKTLNDNFYAGKGVINIYSLSEDPQYKSTGGYHKDYDPYIRLGKDVKVSVRLELKEPGASTPSCDFTLWEKENENKQMLKVYFPNMPTRVETFTIFFGLHKIRNIKEGDDWKYFNIAEFAGMNEVENYIAEMVKLSPHFGPGSINL